MAVPGSPGDRHIEGVTVVHQGSTGRLAVRLRQGRRRGDIGAPAFVLGRRRRPTNASASSTGAARAEPARSALGPETAKALDAAIGDRSRWRATTAASGSWAPRSSRTTSTPGSTRASWLDPADVDVVLPAGASDAPSGSSRCGSRPARGRASAAALSHGRRAVGCVRAREIRPSWSTCTTCSRCHGGRRLPRGARRGHAAAGARRPPPTCGPRLRGAAGHRLHPAGRPGLVLNVQAVAVFAVGLARRRPGGRRRRPRGLVAHRRAGPAGGRPLSPRSPSPCSSPPRCSCPS